MSCSSCVQADLTPPCLDVKKPLDDTVTLRLPVTDDETGDRIDLSTYPNLAATYRVGTGDWVSLTLTTEDVSPDLFDSVILIEFPDTIPDKRVSWRLRDEDADLTWLEGMVIIE